MVQCLTTVLNNNQNVNDVSICRNNPFGYVGWLWLFGFQKFYLNLQPLVYCAILEYQEIPFLLVILMENCGKMTIQSRAGATGLF